MIKKLFLNVVILIIGLTLLACSQQTAPIESSPTIMETATEDNSTFDDMSTTPAVTVTPIGWMPLDDIGYYEGVVVITQYYTLLGHGFYE